MFSKAKNTTENWAAWCFAFAQISFNAWLNRRQLGARICLCSRSVAILYCKSGCLRKTQLYTQAGTGVKRPVIKAVLTSHVKVSPDHTWRENFCPKPMA